jgi:hypothetical protein
MNYYKQSFTYDGGSSLCFGEMGAHDHDSSVKFTSDITKYLEAQKCKNIRAGGFQSNQPKPASGKEFRWSSSKKKWEKV